MVGVGDVTSTLVSMKLNRRRNGWCVRRYVWGKRDGVCIFKMRDCMMRNKYMSKRM